MRSRWWRSPTTHLVVAAAACIALRLAHLLSLLGTDPLLILPEVDAQGFHTWALSILSEPFGSEVFYQSPAYPYVVAAVYRVAGPSWTAMAVVQCVVAGLSAWLAADVATRLWSGARAGEPAVATQQQPPERAVDGPGENLDPRWVGVCAAWLFALYGPLVFYSALLLKVEFTVFVTLACLACLLRAVGTGRWQWWFAAGVLVGVGGLLRGNMYAVLPLLMVWSVWRTRQWRVAVWLVVGAMILPGAVTVRNGVVGGEWVFSNASSGPVAYEGNNPGVADGIYRRPPFVRSHPQFEAEDYRREAERRAGQAMTLGQSSRFWWGETLAYAADDPYAAASRIAHKLGMVVESFELGDNFSFAFHREHSVVLRICLVGWPWILALGLSGLWMGWRRNPTQVGLVVCVALGYAASLLLFYVRARFRIPVVVCMLVLSAPAIFEWRVRLRAKAWGQLAVPALVFVLALAASYALGARQTDELSHWRSRLAYAHLRAGDVERALPLLMEASTESPADPSIAINLGRTQLLVEDWVGAAHNCRIAREAPPSANGPQVDPETARDCEALALLEQGRSSDAWTVLRPALRTTSPPERQLLAAEIAWRGGDPGAARALLEQALRENDDPRLRNQLDAYNRHEVPIAVPPTVP